LKIFKHTYDIILFWQDHLPELTGPIQETGEASINIVMVREEKTAGLTPIRCGRERLWGHTRELARGQ
jgi:hypothetical protein